MDPQNNLTDRLDNLTLEEMFRLADAIFKKPIYNTSTIRDFAAFEYRNRKDYFDKIGDRFLSEKDIEPFPDLLNSLKDNEDYRIVDNKLLRDIIDRDNSKEGQNIKLLYDDFYLNKESYKDAWAMLYSDNPPREMEQGPGAPDYEEEMDNARDTMEEDAKLLRLSLYDYFLQNPQISHILTNPSKTETDITYEFENRVSKAAKEIKQFVEENPNAKDYQQFVLDVIDGKHPEPLFNKVNIQFEPLTPDNVPSDMKALVESFGKDITSSHDLFEHLEDHWYKLPDDLRKMCVKADSALSEEMELHFSPLVWQGDKLDASNQRALLSAMYRASLYERLNVKEAQHVEVKENSVSEEVSEKPIPKVNISSYADNPTATFMVLTSKYGGLRANDIISSGLDVKDIDAFKSKDPASQIRLVQAVFGKDSVNSETIKDYAGFEFTEKYGKQDLSVLVPSMMEIIKLDNTEAAASLKTKFDNYLQTSEKYHEAEEMLIGDEDGFQLSDQGYIDHWSVEKDVAKEDMDTYLSLIETELPDYFAGEKRFDAINKQVSTENMVQFQEKLDKALSDVKGTLENCPQEEFDIYKSVSESENQKGFDTGYKKGKYEGFSDTFTEIAEYFDVEDAGTTKELCKNIETSLAEEAKNQQKSQSIISRIMKAANVNWGKDKDGNPYIPTPEQIGQRFAFHRNNSQNATELQKSVDTLREQQNSFIERLQSSLRKMLPASLFNTLSALDRQIHSPYSSTTLHPQVERNLAEVVGGLSSEQRKETAEGIAETERLLLGDWKQGHEKLDRLSSVLVEKSQEVQAEEQQQSRGLQL